jgi:hypothetical protein
MVEVSSGELERGSELQAALVSWARRLQPSDLRDIRYQVAFEAFDEALVATIEYMMNRRNGGSRDYDRERELTSYWRKASQAISPIDPELSDACMQKGLGWTDPNAWESAKRQGLKIGIEDMQMARMTLNKKRQTANSSATFPSWFPIAGAGFAVVTVLFLDVSSPGPDSGSTKENDIRRLYGLLCICECCILGRLSSGKREPSVLSTISDSILCLWWNRHLYCRFSHPSLGELSTASLIWGKLSATFADKRALRTMAAGNWS